MSQGRQRAGGSRGGASQADVCLDYESDLNDWMWLCLIKEILLSFQVGCILACCSIVFAKSEKLLHNARSWELSIDFRSAPEVQHWQVFVAWWDVASGFQSETINWIQMSNNFSSWTVWETFLLRLQPRDSVGAFDQWGTGNLTPSSAVFVQMSSTRHQTLSFRKCCTTEDSVLQKMQLLISLYVSALHCWGGV